ncbi:D-Ala-D-Ala carboxypeptidase [Clostridium botulinum]|uniref:D-alanyl-D-alanine carboxypeptidase family protein n=1 Tax=Clostridium botulinum TaxID=1491 RepID=UPI0005975A68|nr:D-alanyl-D-alanine carboxypeptidase family protein [Clostridium botulinum]KIL08830.1 D-Ala-D-Ala carboxypeptidase [Clostridium botulinum]MBY6932510.1 D-alanyl-D-alanine carboxypeptidase [Clostridium botulinum]NFL84711.1 D-alanyl-D-alanine carboxypeptidase [Clostridium botulinum]NFN11485.1 D-alanyl-D-alanine carboxypeptidase [Clostridium botulinum]NFO36530.1 D-alanyl-D-alanine carboxypeptidase [Clostridium botulinum]
MKSHFKILIFFLSIFLVSSINVMAASAPPEINAEGSVLMDASTGEILFSKNPDKVLEPASTTKVMTAILTLENCDLNEEVVVTEDFTKVDGTTIGLLKGDIVTVKDLLLGLLLESGNDAANALACHISSSIDKFAVLMNKKAIEIGAINTHFKNPSGLPDPEHLTTAHDLALIMNEAIKNDRFLELSKVMTYEIPIKNDSSRTIWINNKNHMINKNSMYYYPYTLAGKNGYTTKSNHTYAIAAENTGHILVASYLNALDKNKNFEDMKTVFNYGFNNFYFSTIYKKGQEIDSIKLNNDIVVPLIASKDVNCVVPNENKDKLNTYIKFEDKNLNRSSFNKGDVILNGTVYLNDEELCKLDLYAGISRNYSIKEEFDSFINKNQKNLIIGASALGVTLLVILTLIIENKKKKKRQKRLLEITTSIPKIQDDQLKRRRRRR